MLHFEKRGIVAAGGVYIACAVGEAHAVVPRFQEGFFAFVKQEAVAHKAVLNGNTAAPDVIFALYAVGQAVCKRKQSLLYALRQMRQTGSRKHRCILPVAAEQLVAAFTGQHYLDVLCRLAGNEIYRNNGRVGNR
ncbi:unknown [Ruminococcus sp. CAG:382]|nr:unknown [Ruminococcus sp. CAG:382]